MNEGSTLLTYAIAEPYGTALRQVRRALARHGLRAPAELDVAARIRHELGAGVAPCAVLWVDDPALLLEAVVFQRGAAAHIPQPLVVTGDNRRSEVLLRSPESLAREVPATVRDPLFDLLKRMARAVESVAGPRHPEFAAASGAEAAFPRR